MDYGTVLEEEEYTLLRGKERYERLEETGDLMPQEMMSWRLHSSRHMQFGEQVMLGHIETVVTAVDIRTRQGELVYEYELSRRKGILTARKTNPRIFGMSIPATVKERKGNQVRVQLDIDPSYAYGSVKFPPAFSRAGLEALEFVPGRKNLVLYGPVGIGKTHMAIAAGVKACMLGYRTKFHTVTELVLKLSEARKNGTLERLLKELRALDLLILDEWGYVPVDKDGSQLLFRVISDSYESKSLILTTNLEFSKWGSIFTDEQMAAAMIDRLVHHGHLLIFEGRSYRMEHALMRQEA